MTESAADDITRVDPTGLLTPVAVGNGASVTAVGEGGVWVTDTGDDAVVRVDPDTRAVKATIPVGNAPAGVALGAGSVWVANGGDGTVSRIDPRTDRVIATISVGGSPQQITVTGGRAWVTIDAPAIPPGRLSAGGGTARLDSRSDVDSMDPALAYEADSWQLLYATCAKLLNYPDKAGLAASQLVPEVAQSLPARSADGKTYTFTIRKGFRFSPPSSAPVTAQTFKDTIERTLNPAMKSPVAGQYLKFTTPGEPFDIAGDDGWTADYPDPYNFLNLLFENATIFPTLENPTDRARLTAAARLSGAKRYLTYARLDADLMRNAAPLVAYGDVSTHELFSTRMRCQTYGFYGLDLAALCVKKTTR